MSQAREGGGFETRTEQNFKPVHRKCTEMEENLK